MEAGPKSPSPETSISDEMAGNFPELIDQLSPDMPIEEELIEEVMQELYKEITPTPATNTAKPSSPAASFPMPSLVVGNGKSESCGASVSDSASTVMAGVKFVGPTGNNGGFSPENGVGAWSECGGNTNNGLVVGKGVMDCCEAGEAVDDEWFERVMNTWAPVDLDPWF
ncbi:uncharacterized protein LOC117614562 [Prunus dulcis]|nr:uncharacterized protein LOC117614562 [Prunus dulcis]